MMLVSYSTVFSFLLAYGHCEHSTGSKQWWKLIATSNFRKAFKNVVLKQFGLSVAMTKNNFM